MSTPARPLDPICACGCGKPLVSHRVKTVARRPVRFLIGHAAPLGRYARFEERFWARADQSGGPDACWNWTGGLLSTGYGRVVVSTNGHESNVRAHRIAYELVKGPITGGLLVCHSCDNPRCVNPAHLWLGTHRDNGRDASIKGRLRRKKAS